MHPIEPTAFSREIRPLFPTPYHRAGRHFRGELPRRRTPRQLANCRSIQRRTVPDSSEHPDALIRIYAARTVRWRGIFAGWIAATARVPMAGYGRRTLSRHCRAIYSPPRCSASRQPAITLFSTSTTKSSSKYEPILAALRNSSGLGRRPADRCQGSGRLAVLQAHQVGIRRRSSGRRRHYSLARRGQEGSKSR